MKKTCEKPGLRCSISTNQGAATASSTTGAGERMRSSNRRHSPITPMYSRKTSPGSTIPIKPFASTASAQPSPSSASDRMRCSSRKKARIDTSASVMPNVSTPSVTL